MEPKGQILGMDIDDAAYIPVATAMRLFNLEELQEIDILLRHVGMTEVATEAGTEDLDGAASRGGRFYDHLPG